jgi:Ferric iron reductase FhuF-like transporter
VPTLSADLLDLAPSHPTPRFAADPFVVADPDDGWIPATALVSGERLAELFELPERLWDAPSHAAAVLAWKTYTYQLAKPLATGWALAREIPLLSADNLLLRVLPKAPYLAVGLRRPASAVLPTNPASQSPDAILAEDEAALLTFFGETLIAQHLQPLLERTKEVRKVGERSLWGQAAAAFAYAFADVSATAMQDAALFTDALPVHGLAGVDDGEAVWRKTCCLAFASPSLTACSDCVTVTRPRASGSGFLSSLRALTRSRSDCSGRSSRVPSAAGHPTRQ